MRQIFIALVALVFLGTFAPSAYAQQQTKPTAVPAAASNHEAMSKQPISPGEDLELLALQEQSKEALETVVGGQDDGSTAGTVVAVVLLVVAVGILISTLSQV